MFKKKNYGKVFYDELIGGNEFLRITTNLNGDYVLYHCCGLAKNGITPLRMEKIATTGTLREAKERAKAYLQPLQPLPPLSPLQQLPDISHVRLPYKD